KIHKFKLPAAGLVALSFFMIICLGTAFLCIPAATADRSVSFLNALFTATSATCVTGLSVAGTAAHWSYFGQAIILLLIQVGGLGFITIISLFMLYVKKHTSLSQRKLVMQSAGSVDLASIKGLVKIILLGTLIFEFVGAFCLCFAFVPVYGWGEGIWQAVFTSVSAFCNAGFTITDAFTKGGVRGGASLVDYVSNPLVNIVVIVLSIIGGIGVFVWGDVIHHGIKINKYSFHSKVVLSTTGVLVVLGWALFMAFEWNNPATIGGKGVGTKILASLFMSVTPRTAGFNTVDYANMSGAGNTLTSVLMLVGGSPGSTAGGLKTTTLAVFVLSMWATSRRYDEIHLYKRRFETDASHQASAIVCLYVLVAVASTMLLCAVEGADASLEKVAFEVISALGTVGLSQGITASLHAFSKVVLIMLMFFGRVGGFTLVLIFSGEKKPVALSRVADKIIIG
ncbi:MAG: Trk family potassium uptake protein, partial [Clostridia bacterium]|nr:Trk family potassium uptake protein [Clostridia bacterium]